MGTLPVSPIKIQEANQFIKENKYRLAIPVVRNTFYRRCKKYSSYWASWNCFKLVYGKENFFDTLGFTFLENTQGVEKEVTFFKDEIIGVLKEESTVDYLSGIKEGLADISLLDGTVFNLWNYTLNFYQQDRLKALRALAVIFQDTTVHHHIDRIYRLKLIDNEAFDLLEGLNYQLNHHEIKETEIYKRGYLKLYPDFLEKSHPSLYHFYMPAYLNAKLSEAKGESPQIRGLSFYLTVFYKTQNYYLKNKILIDDLKSFPLATTSDRFRSIDLYMAYAGSHWDKELLSFEEFTSEINKNLKEFLKKTFRSK